MSLLLQAALLLAAGFAALFSGAEGLVRGAARTAAALGVSALVVALTIVSLQLHRRNWW